MLVNRLVLQSELLKWDLPFISLTMDIFDVFFYSDYSPKTILVLYFIVLCFIGTAIILVGLRNKLIKTENESLKPLWLFRKSNLIPLSTFVLIYFATCIVTIFLPTIFYCIFFFITHFIALFLEHIDPYSIIIIFWLSILSLAVCILFLFILLSPIALIYYVLSFIIIFLIQIIISWRTKLISKKVINKCLNSTFSIVTLDNNIFSHLTVILSLGPLCFIVYLMYLFTKQFDVALYVNHVSIWLNGILQNNWQFLLILALGPIVIISLCYIILAIKNIVFIRREQSFIKQQNIHFCCPKCGERSFDYIVNEKVYPIPLIPSTYGTLYHYFEGQRIPTLIVNGKDKLERRCRECGCSIFPHKEKYSLVSDIHVAIIGTPTSGKSWLMICVLYRMLVRLGKRAYQTDLCYDNNIKTIYNILHNSGVFNFETTANHAFQILIERKTSIIPLLLYWWEHNDSQKVINLNFYKNVSTIIFVIDPLSTLYDQAPPSPALQLMLDANQSRYSVYNILQNLNTILDSLGRNSQEIDIIVTLTKADRGYIEQTLGISYKTATSDNIKRFVTTHMRLNNFVNNLNNMFASVTFTAISLFDNDVSTIDNYINTVSSVLVKA